MMIKLKIILFLLLLYLGLPSQWTQYYDFMKQACWPRLLTLATHLSCQSWQKDLTRRERLQVWERHNTSKYKSSQSTFYFPKVHWSGDHDVQKIWSFVLFIKKSTACFKDFQKSQQINTYNLYILAANFSSNKNIWSIFQQIQLLLSMSTPKISYNYMY